MTEPITSWSKLGVDWSDYWTNQRSDLTPVAVATAPISLWIYCFRYITIGNSGQNKPCHICACLSAIGLKPQINENIELIQDAGVRNYTEDTVSA